MGLCMGKVFTPQRIDAHFAASTVILVVSLPGNIGDYTNIIHGNYDSGTVNRHCTDEMVILSCAKQCIPILQFASHQAFDEGNLLLERYHAELQKIIDNMFEKGHDAATGHCVSTILQTEAQQIVPLDCSDDDDLLGLHIIDKLLFRPKIHCSNNDDLLGLQIIDKFKPDHQLVQESPEPMVRPPARLGSYLAYTGAAYARGQLTGHSS
jgi:hypothetical protein